MKEGTPLESPVVARRLTDAEPEWETVASQLKVPWVGWYCCHPAGVEPDPVSKPPFCTSRVTGTRVTSSNHAVPVLPEDCKAILADVAVAGAVVSTESWAQVVVPVGNGADVSVPTATPAALYQVTARSLVPLAAEPSAHAAAWNCWPGWSGLMIGEATKAARWRWFRRWR